MIYFIRCGEFVKIGYSTKPAARLAMMDIYCPVAPELAGVLPGGRDVEHRIHFVLRDHHVRREWFRWCQDVVEIIANGPPAIDATATEIRLTRKRLGMFAQAEAAE